MDFSFHHFSSILGSSGKIINTIKCASKNASKLWGQFSNPNFFDVFLIGFSIFVIVAELTFIGAIFSSPTLKIHRGGGTFVQAHFYVFMIFFFFAMFVSAIARPGKAPF